MRCKWPAGFLYKCEQWRNHVIPENFLADSGKIWIQISNVNFSFWNCGWFQPYNFIAYSIVVLYKFGHIYLPHTIRFKPENVLITRVIPGPNEPNFSKINSYLRQLVKELDSGVMI